MATQGDKVAINFLEITNQPFQISFYSKKVIDPEQQSPHPNIKRYNLPGDLNNLNSAFVPYFISETAFEGFELITVSSAVNKVLTVYKLFENLVDKCKQTLREGTNFTVEYGFRKKVNIVISSSVLGNEEIWIEPYFLNISDKFGYLIGFHFNLADGQPFNKAVQQKSLSLGPDGRENINFYADIYRKLQHFIGHFKSIIFPLGQGIDLTASFQEIPSKHLDAKKYIFYDGRIETSQFQGIKKHGPLVKMVDNCLICFMYRPDDKPYSYELFHALKGNKFGTFPGMEAMFSFSLGKEHVTGLPLADYSEKSIDAAITHLKEIAVGRPTLPLLLIPWSRIECTSEEDDIYYRIKHQFLSKGLPTQFVSLQRMRERDGLKWSISNIGLGIFSKLGGLPWKLQPRHEKCLIVGIGQAHRKQNDGTITRYFAYSVLSDSSGLYDSIKILSQSEQKDTYLNGLTENIKSVIKSMESKYDKFVIHTPFKLKLEEVEALKVGVTAIAGNEIVVMKFNEHSKYFGFAPDNNSKVPFESSCVPLGKRQYLVWFEGLQHHNPTIRRRIAKPMHVEFIYSSKELNSNDEISYLQDAINLSGANWRGFNAKTSPVSVYYAKIIADYIGCFDRLGLPEIDIENMPPWFL
ncbi:Piwi domain-containing protein [Methylomonas sp. UP202]|uniref:Piwi domain-containing protein n=1 Tax=Methylomonas sp. UP202 TaxID=3040943 RepID=UPI002478C675|nr:Piwi domain-containing protein [Methylomonas sp. UP202]WGS87726.1 Piwi domain-containing protein [Methylomonas sp. UP202]